MSPARALALSATRPERLDLGDVAIDTLDAARPGADDPGYTLFIVPPGADPAAMDDLGRAARTAAFCGKHIACLRDDRTDGAVPRDVARCANWLPPDLPDAFVGAVLRSLALDAAPEIGRDCPVPGTFSLRFALRTLDDVTRCMTAARHLCGLNGGMSVGVQELLINAIEHGNLEISFDEKSRLLEGGLWQEEIARRIRDACYASRVAVFELSRNARETRLRIRDDGAGFDPDAYTSADARPRHPLHGRGISMARAAGFRKLEYLGRGNEVVAAFDSPPRRAA